jgi:hypothetical protein
MHAQRNLEENVECNEVILSIGQKVKPLLDVLHQAAINNQQSISILVVLVSVVPSGFVVMVVVVITTFARRSLLLLMNDSVGLMLRLSES